MTTGSRTWPKRLFDLWGDYESAPTTVAGNDSFNQIEGAVFGIHGGYGNDTVTATLDSLTLDGGAGIDTATVKTLGAGSSLLGGPGDDGPDLDRFRVDRIDAMTGCERAL